MTGAAVAEEVPATAACHPCGLFLDGLGAGFRRLLLLVAHDKGTLLKWAGTAPVPDPIIINLRSPVCADFDLQDVGNMHCARHPADAADTGAGEPIRYPDLIRRLRFADFAKPHVTIT
ncbi:MAG: hypothetical protein M5U35_11135 [Roseovarius sp.]|nr:hypothetical protein [Roseovarius sp.]